MLKCAWKIGTQNKGIRANAGIQTTKTLRESSFISGANVQIPSKRVRTIIQSTKLKISVYENSTVIFVSCVVAVEQRINRQMGITF